MKKMVIMSTLLLTSAASMADGVKHHFYVAPNLGQSSFDISQDDLDEVALAIFEAGGFTVTDAESSFDDEGTPWSLVAGWRFSPYFAAEVGYTDLGKVDYSAEGTLLFGPFPFDGTADIGIKAKGPTAALVGIAPIGQKFDLHAKAGVLFAKTELSVAATASNPNLGTARGAETLDGDSKDLFYGAGAAYHFTDRIAATLDYLLYKDVGNENDTGEGDIDSLTLGLVIGF